MIVLRSIAQMQVCELQKKFNISSIVSSGWIIRKTDSYKNPSAVFFFPSLFFIEYRCIFTYPCARVCLILFRFFVYFCSSLFFPNYNQFYIKAPKLDDLWPIEKCGRMVWCTISSTTFIFITSLFFSRKSSKTSISLPLDT